MQAKKYGQLNNLSVSVSWRDLPSALSYELE